MAEVAGDGAPVSARTASISLALPVSIISAPAPTVTMTTTGTPMAAACNARRRRDADTARRGTDQGPRAAAASLTDPCQARNSSSGSLNDVPPAQPGVPPSVSGALKGSVRLTDSGACGSSATGAPSGIRPAPAGQACPGKPSAGYSLQAGAGRCARQPCPDPAGAGGAGDPDPRGWSRWASTGPRPAGVAPANRESAGPAPVNHVSAPPGPPNSSSAPGSNPAESAA